MDMTATFSTVAFSPAPEFLSPVNVGLIVSNGTQHLYFDERFRRLRGVAPGFDFAALAFLLNSLNVELRDVPPDAVQGLVASKSAQFLVSTPRPLLCPADDAAVQALIGAYVMPLGKRDRRAERPSEACYIDTRLQGLLDGHVHPPRAAVMCRAHPKDVLSPGAARLLGGTPLRFSRVITGQKGILLLDGVNLESRNHSYIRNRTDHVAFMYYTVGKHQHAVEDMEQRFLRRLAVVFDMPAVNANPRFGFYVSNLERNADLLVDADDAAKLGAMADQCLSAVG
jgi:hypothetical protein